MDLLVNAQNKPFFEFSSAICNFTTKNNMSTGIFIPMTKCAHDIPYQRLTHETNLSSNSSLVFTGDILNSRNLSCRNHVPCSWFRN